MKKLNLSLVAVVILVAVGLVLSFYGSQIITEGLTTNNGRIGSGSTLEIVAELDPEISEKAVYVVQTMEFSDNSVSAKLYDPFGSMIISKNIEKDSYEERFDLLSKGTYKLVIENIGKESEIIGVLGHLPDAGKFSIGITGFYILIVGLFGMVGVAVFAIRNRKRN